MIKDYYNLSDEAYQMFLDNRDEYLKFRREINEDFVMQTADWTDNEIGELYGISGAGVRHIIKTAFKKIRKPMADLLGDNYQKDENGFTFDNLPLNCTPSNFSDDHGLSSAA